jgi:hypothetical protein
MKKTDINSDVYDKARNNSESILVHVLETYYNRVEGPTPSDVNTETRALIQTLQSLSLKSLQAPATISTPTATPAAVSPLVIPTVIPLVELNSSTTYSKTISKLNLTVKQPKHDARKLKQLMEKFNVDGEINNDHSNDTLYKSDSKTQAYVGSHMESHHHQATPDQRIARAKQILKS